MYTFRITASQSHNYFDDNFGKIDAICRTYVRSVIGMLGFLRLKCTSEKGKNTHSCVCVCVPDFNLFELLNDKGV